MAKESNEKPSSKGTPSGKPDLGKIQDRQTGKLNESKIPDFKFTPPAPPPPPKDSGNSDKK